MIGVIRAPCPAVDVSVLAVDKAFHPNDPIYRDRAAEQWGCANSHRDGSSGFPLARETANKECAATLSM